MFPTIGDLINSLFGLNINLPLPMFGLMVACAFMAAYYIIVLEFKRYNKLGILKEKTITVNKAYPLSNKDYIIPAITGLILGHKLLGIILDYNLFSENPQSYIFSLKGNIIGGLIGMGILIYLRYKEHIDEVKEFKKPTKIEEKFYPHNHSGNIIILGVVFGIIGAKIFHNLEYFSDFKQDVWGSLFSVSGLTFYGGLIFSAIAIIYYANKNKIPSLLMCDIAAPAIIIGYAIGRIGCQLAGDGDWGIENLLPKPEYLSFLPDWMWAYKYPHNVINDGVPIANCVGRYCHELANPVFPTPFYETILSFVIFFTLWFIRKKIKTTGILFSLFLILTGIERFVIERIRINSEFNFLGKSITQAELISAILIIFGVFGIIYLNVKKNTKNTIKDI